MMSNSLDHDKVIRISNLLDSKPKIAIMGRDSLTTGLLADAIVNGIHCEAVAVRSADPSQFLGGDYIDLAIIHADVNRSPGSGFDLAAMVSSNHPSTRIVILLDDYSRELVIRAIRSGARGVFNLQDSMTDFIDCINHVRTGSIWAKNAAADYLMEAIKQIPDVTSLASSNLLLLTTRELQVVRAAGKGGTNRAIAQELNLSEHTVKNYLFRAFEKLGVSSRVELLFYLAIQGRTLSTMCEKS